MTQALAVTIPGAPRNPYTEISARYDYALDKCKCPNCGGMGMPWSGWFSCDSCSCIAVVATGRAFVSTGAKS